MCSLITLLTFNILDFHSCQFLSDLHPRSLENRLRMLCVDIESWRDLFEKVLGFVRDDVGKIIFSVYWREYAMAITSNFRCSRHGLKKRVGGRKSRCARIGESRKSVCSKGTTIPRRIREIL
jgi:hypothetical protein